MWIRIAAFAVVAAMAAAAAGLFLYQDDEQRLRDDLKRLSQGRAPSGILTEYDAVCFDNGGARADLDEAALRSGLNFQPSINACGIDRSCCNLRSDLGGLAGLVRGDEIKCVEVNRFTYLLDGEQPFCTAPAQLTVVERTFTTRFNPPGRPWFSTIGRPYFQIGRRP